MFPSLYMGVVQGGPAFPEAVRNITAESLRLATAHTSSAGLISKQIWPFVWYKVCAGEPYARWMSAADMVRMLDWVSPYASEEQAARIASVCRGLRPGAPVNNRAVARKHRWMIAHRQSYVCATCNMLLHPKGFDIDHVVELRDGGKDELDNLQALCATCHAKKTRTR